MSEQLRTFYILHGEDDFSIRAEVNRFRQQMDDFNVTEFEGDAVNVNRILAAVQAMPFLSDKRMVIVEGMLSYLIGKNSKAAKEELEHLAEALPKLPEFCRLVFVELQPLSDKNPFMKKMQEEKRGFIREYSAPKNPLQWIKKQAEVYQVDIDSAALNALVQLLMRDKKVNLREADNELIKLVAYVGHGGKITEAIVAELTTYVSEANIFEMVDSLAQRDGKKAIALAHRLLDDKKQNDPLSLFGMIIRQFRLLLQTREILEIQHGTVSTVAETLKIQDFIAKKLANQVRQFDSLEELEGIYRQLLEIDIAIKTGRISPDLSLDLFISAVTK
jgi:DNA polymerase-3 subunit delta